MRRQLSTVREEREESGGSSLVRRYSPEEQQRDDLRELLEVVDDHFGNLDRAIHDAGNYRTFFLTLGFLRDSTLDGYFFVMEWDKNTRLWTVGYKREKKTGRWRALKDILIHDAKIDTAVNAMLEVWKTWAEDVKGEGADEA